ncbi:hypothetical protein SS1G_01775 [Sclerotinia sclerotiorum 1980 UF-70]|uniref:Uncharacterized protein n=1 Tax=Sclerotinia sclerotiorum (strain ATCC 18683 / 1980 / Ss-1) TaxID=665079 RepID=A7E8Z7_SCLS1|nr:hypothetical protein SS1G_01775 [Sclerotinia sclerotiorum 1980 UF-70]EDN96849.1 hypothetical protein SS1G_01775 [Sclerotinia sclerotiorum 1980 UF-70]
MHSFPGTWWFTFRYRTAACAFCRCLKKIDKLYSVRFKDPSLNPYDFNQFNEIFNEPSTTSSNVFPSKS